MVRSDGTVIAGHAFNISNANITNPTRGIYCFDLAGIGITSSNAVVVATPDYRDGATSSSDTLHVNTGTGLAEFNACPDGQIEVRTYTSGGTSFDPEGFDIAFM